MIYFIREEVVPIIIQEVVNKEAARCRMFHACTLVNEHEARRTDLATDGTLGRDQYVEQGLQ